MHILRHGIRQSLAVFLVLQSVSAYAATDAAREMAHAATALATTLDSGQKQKALFDLDTEALKQWHFVPSEMVTFGRKGLPIPEMKPEQRALALALLRSSLSAGGYQKATNIMSLETILRDLEQNDRFERNPEKYYVAIFGNPTPDGTWAWRFEGHHLSMTFTIVEGKEFAATPSFFGTNPAEVLSGDRKGLRVLAAEEDLAYQFVRSLDAVQKAVAIIETTAPNDIFTAANRDITPLKPTGLGYGSLSATQQETLRTLVREYVGRVRPDIAAEQLKIIEATGWDKVSFAWAGGLEKGQGHYYRVQGERFLLEFDNTQNNANHIHAVWRDFRNDYGNDILKRHYQDSHGKHGEHAH